MSNKTTEELLTIYRTGRKEKYPEEFNDKNPLIIARKEKEKFQYEEDHPTFTDEQWMKVGNQIREYIAKDIDHEVIKGIAIAASRMK